MRVICHLDRRLIGVIWQGTWHGSCDMTWYDIVTTLLGGHQPANTHIDVVRSDLRGQYWHYCFSRGYWHYWGGCCWGYQCLSSHTAHTPLIVWLITSDMARPRCGLLSAIIMDPTLKPDNVPDWLTERNIKPQDQKLMMAAGSRHLSGGEGGALNMINPANTRHCWQKLTSLSSSKWRRPLSPLNKNLMWCLLSAAPWWWAVKAALNVWWWWPILRELGYYDDMWTLRSGVMTCFLNYIRGQTELSDERGERGDQSYIWQHQSRPIMET